MSYSSRPAKRAASGGYFKPYYPRRRVGHRYNRSHSYGSPRSRAVAALAREVARVKQSVPAHMSRAPKKVTLLSSSNIVLEIPGYRENVTFFPVTWAIPTARPTTSHPDERFREGNQVWLTGVRVRFTVRYMHTWRLRMVCYSPQTAAGVVSFVSHIPAATSSTPAAVSSNPVAQWKLDFVQPNDSKVMPGGPFASNLVDRQRADGGVYTFDSVDGTLYSADLGKGALRPKAQMQHTVNLMDNGQQSTAVKEIDWYVPIHEMVEFQNERSANAMSGNYQIMVYYDVPQVVVTPRAPGSQVRRVGTIVQPNVTVYYR